MVAVEMNQLVWGMVKKGMERYRGDLESQVSIGKNARVVIGGDFNASVRVTAKRPGVCGNYELEE